MSDPLDAFDSWFLRRVAHAVEAGKIPADLLTALREEMEEARERSQADG